VFPGRSQLLPGFRRQVSGGRRGQQVRERRSAGKDKQKDKLETITYNNPFTLNMHEQKKTVYETICNI
jgi:hypothetical protein